MKKSVISLLVLIVVTGVGLFLYFKPENNVAVNKGTAKPVLLYSVSNDSSSKVYSYDPATGIVNTIFNYSPLSGQGTPLYEQYDTNSFLAYRIEGDDTSVKRINLNGDRATSEVTLPYDSFLFSPSGRKVAFSRYNESTKEFDFVVRDMSSGKEKSFPNVVQTNSIVGRFDPIWWSEDEAYMYARVVIDTEGYVANLSKIDATTLAVSESPFVRDNEVVLVSIDKKENAYGVNNRELDFMWESGPRQIYRINLKDQSHSTFPLSNSQVTQLLNVNPGGTYIPYTDLHGDLWVYDFVQQRESRVTTGNLVSAKRAFWREDTDTFAFTAINQSAHRLNIYLYDAKTGSLHDISSVDSLGTTLEVIGWFSTKE